MYTSTVLFALSTLVSNGELVPERPAWLNDYGVACRRGVAERKPLAVFIGAGKVGWEGVSRRGDVGAEVRDLLAAHYVCVYVDSNRTAGRELAEAFAVYDGVGLIISDHSGKLQAFRHEGELQPRELETYLRRYADPDRMAVTTETREDLQPRPVPPVQAPVNYAPVRYAPVGRGC